MPPKRKALSPTDDDTVPVTPETARLHSLRKLAYTPPDLAKTTPTPATFPTGRLQSLQRLANTSPEPAILTAAPPATPPTPATPTSKKPATPASKKKAKHSGYAPPSEYAHLSGIPDVLAPDLILVFVGTNPGLRTAETGHAYSSPTNHFWRLLHGAGLTPDRRCAPADDLRLPELYSLGNTNLVARPTRDQAQLSPAEMEAAVPALEAKIRACRPEAVCIVGKGIWDRVYKVKTGHRIGKDFAFGWQNERMGECADWDGARVFVAVSTSGLTAGYTIPMKLEIMKEVGDWVQQRRKERGETAPRGLPDEVVEAAARRRQEEFRKGWMDVKTEGGEGEIETTSDVEGAAEVKMEGGQG